MPYEIRFNKKVAQKLSDDEYINDCCMGGDVIQELLLPELKKQHSDVFTCQEDWGWYIGIRKGKQTLEVAIYTEDFDAGNFMLRLESMTKKGWFRTDRSDTLDLIALEDFIVKVIDNWTGRPSGIEKVAGP